MSRRYKMIKLIVFAFGWHCTAFGSSFVDVKFVIQNNVKVIFKICWKWIFAVIFQSFLNKLKIPSVVPFLCLLCLHINDLINFQFYDNLISLIAMCISHRKRNIQFICCFMHKLKWYANLKQRRRAVNLMVQTPRLYWMHKETETKITNR